MKIPLADSPATLHFRRLRQGKAGTAFTATFDNQDCKLTHNSRTFTYNANGDRTSVTFSPRSTASYSYDELGVLSHMTTRAGVLESYGYDGFNHRVNKIQSGTFKYHLLRDRQGRIAAKENSSGVITQEYVYATDQNAPDYSITAGKTAPFLEIADERGSIRLVVNSATGTVVQQIGYDDIGDVLTDTNSAYQPFYFAGGFYDASTRLLTFGARDYHPRHGVWMTKDPILFNGGDTNLYGYVLNDPVNFVDPDGTGPLGTAIGVGIGVIGEIGVEIGGALMCPKAPPKDDPKACSKAFDASMAGCNRIADEAARRQCSTMASQDYVRCVTSSNGG